VSNADRDDYRNFGCPQIWNGIPLMVIPQRFTLGTDTLKLDDTVIYVVPANIGKPIKGVNADPYFSIGDPASNLDLSTDIVAIDQWQYGSLFPTTGKMGLIDLT